MNPAMAVFNLMLGTLFTHELDAMTQSEWRLLYVLRGLPPPDGQFWFVVLHVPLFAAVMWLTQQAPLRIREMAQNALAAFAVIHAGLHYRLSDDPLYTFHSPLSVALIAGAALLGLLFFFMTRNKPLAPPSGQ